MTSELLRDLARLFLKESSAVIREKPRGWIEQANHLERESDRIRTRAEHAERRELRAAARTKLNRNQAPKGTMA